MTAQNDAPPLPDATRQRLEAQLADPAVQDALNPNLLLQTTTTDLLLAIAGGLVDPVAIARHELACRGIGTEGQWVGHDRAREIWGV